MGKDALGCPPTEDRLGSHLLGWALQSGCFQREEAPSPPSRPRDRPLPVPPEGLCRIRDPRKTETFFHTAFEAACPSGASGQALHLHLPPRWEGSGKKTRPQRRQGTLESRVLARPGDPMEIETAEKQPSISTPAREG